MPSVTLTRLTSLILDRLETNTALYTNAQIAAVVNESFRIINGFCGINQATVTVPGGTIANQLIYNVPTSLLFPITVWVDGIQLRKDSLVRLSRDHQFWATDTTLKCGPIHRWAMIGVKTFVLHPIDSIGGRLLEMTGVIEPPTLVGGSDVISVEDDFLVMMVDYCAHRIQLKEGGKVFADSSTLIQSFYAKLKDRMILTGIKFPRYHILVSEASQ